MAEARRWVRQELLLVLNLYEKLRFGQFDSNQPVVIDVAKRMQRTPGSLAMKLCNLASLDSKLQVRGIVGLQGASNLDREVWAEFQANRDRMVPESEEAMRELFHAGDAEEVEVVGDKGVKLQPAASRPEGPTSTSAHVIVRRGQQYFRQAVLSVFSGRCGVTGIGVRELVVASHILPWAKYPRARLEPQNGVALSRLHDGAFDRGLISFDEEYRLILSDRLRGHFPQRALEENFSAYEGRPLTFASDVASPSPDYLAVHRKEWGFA